MNTVTVKLKNRRGVTLAQLDKFLEKAMWRCSDESGPKSRLLLNGKPIRRLTAVADKRDNLVLTLK
jgi:hypothetical protein